MRSSDWSSDVCSSDLDSMMEAGILDGDFALVQRTEVARDGQIVIALIDESEATLKYFHREGPRIRLDPANAAYEPQIYDASQVRIQGKLAGLLRRYNRSEEHTSELQSLMRISYAVFCMKQKKS